MIIERKAYLNKLIEGKHNSLIKVITGLRRVGKSFLLKNIFVSHLKECGVEDINIIYVSLEHILNKKLLKPEAFYKFLESKLVNNNMHYFIIDEIQLVKDFETVLMSLMSHSNVDIYVTGSNSKFLSTDIKTQFRGRGYTINVWPLSFNEVYEFYNQNINEYNMFLSNNGDINKNKVYEVYSMYGGLPLVVLAKTEIEKRKMLKELYENIYHNDITERYKIKNEYLLISILEIIANNIGSILNINKLQRLIDTENKQINYETVARYIKILEESFMIHQVKRFDYKNSKIMKGFSKYYFYDLGIRNHILSYMKNDLGFLMENAVANNLKINDFETKVGYVLSSTLDKNHKKIKLENEIDFICNYNSNIYYIQSCYDFNNQTTYDREIKSLNSTKNNYKKIIIVKQSDRFGIYENGIHIIDLIKFLIDFNMIL